MHDEDFQEIIRVQQMMSQRLMQERQLDRKIDVLNIINDLTNNGMRRTQVEAVLLECQMAGINENDSEHILDELVSDHLITRSKGGFIERA